MIPEQVSTKSCLRWPTCPAMRAATKDDYKIKMPCTETDWRICPLTEGGNKVEAKI